jgi:hypothetical protein
MKILLAVVMALSVTSSVWAVECASLKEGQCKEKAAECSWKDLGGGAAPECIVKPTEKTSSDPRVCEKINGNDGLGAKRKEEPAKGTTDSAAGGAAK